MESVLGVVQSPIFLSALIFLGLISLIRILLVRDHDLKRAHSGDRRRGNNKMPDSPFHDSEGILVTENRRVQSDRRHTGLSAMEYEMGEDSAAG